MVCGTDSVLLLLLLLLMITFNLLLRVRSTKGKIGDHIVSSDAMVCRMQNGE
jgi:hypothetical protein